MYFRYCLQICDQKWYYTTPQEAWNDRHLDVRRNFGKLDFGDNTITGVRTYEEFIQHLDAGDVLRYHALKVYKVDNGIITNKDP